MKIVSVGLVGVVLVMVFGAPSRVVAPIAIALSLVISMRPTKNRRNG
jgi:hypothetical protein